MYSWVSVLLPEVSS